MRTFARGRTIAAAAGVSVAATALVAALLAQPAAGQPYSGAVDPVPSASTSATDPDAPAPSDPPASEVTAESFWDEPEAEEATEDEQQPLQAAQAEAARSAVAASPEASGGDVDAVSDALVKASAAAAPAAGLNCNAQRVNVFDRFGQCVFVRNGGINYYWRGRLVGRVALQMKRQLQLSATRTRFTEQDSFQVISVTGRAVGTRLQSFKVSCTGTCSAKVSFTSQVLTPRKTFSGSVTYSDTTTAKNSTRSTYTLIFNNPTYGLNAVTVYSKEYRCDAQIGRTRGCVIPSFRPTLTTMAALPHIAANIRAVQAGGHAHYGNRTLSNGRNPLSRTTSAALYNANRAVACPANRPRPAPDPKTGIPWECDEYPFARTNQGASKVPPADWGWAWVPATEQRSQGGLLNAFVVQNRVLNNDQYWVAV